MKESPYFSVSFDESLNGSFQNCQNDFIRYWSQKKCKLRRYILDFKLLSHQAAKNMNILIISLRKHISQMDGQTARWSFSIIFCLGITKLKTSQSYWILKVLFYILSTVHICVEHWVLNGIQKECKPAALFSMICQQRELIIQV